MKIYAVLVYWGRGEKLCAFQSLIHFVITKPDYWVPHPHTNIEVFLKRLVNNKYPPRSPFKVFTVVKYIRSTPSVVREANKWKVSKNEEADRYQDKARSLYNHPIKTLS